jgi:hypothetical protein
VPTKSAGSVAVLAADPKAALLDFTRGGGFVQKQIARLDALPAHGNRTLKTGQLFGGLLLSFFDTLARSLRMIEDKADFDGCLDLPRLARSTTSDALAALDASRLKPIIDELLGQVPKLAHTDGDLSCITRQIIAADGTYMTTLSDVAWALGHTRRDGRRQGQVRANVQMDTVTWTPRVVSISGNGSLEEDESSEPAAVAKDLLSNVLYVLDRNFLEFEFLKALLAKDNDFVLRVKENAPSVAVLESLKLTEEDAQAGVSSDQIVQLTGVGAPEGTFRLVTIQTTNRKNEPETIRLLSSLTDTRNIAARVIGLIYRKRWQIELFFKWLKTFANMDHLISTSRNGITFQFYVAVIGVLLMYVQSGKRISIYSLAALSRLARGECTLEQALAVINKREHERELNRKRQAKKRAAKTTA